MLVIMIKMVLMMMTLMTMMNDHLKWVDPCLHLTKPPPQAAHLPNIRHHHDDEGHYDHDQYHDDHDHDINKQRMTSSSISE